MGPRNHNMVTNFHPSIRQKRHLVHCYAPDLSRETKFPGLETNGRVGKETPKVGNHTFGFKCWQKRLGLEIKRRTAPGPPREWSGWRGSGPGGGTERWGNEGRGPKMSRFFFSSPALIFALLLSLVASRGILVVF